MVEQRVTVGMAKGGGDMRSKHRGPRRPDAPPTLAEVGIDKDLAKAARKLAAIPEAKFDRIIEEGRRLSECKKELDHGNWLPWLEREFGRTL